MYSTSTVRERVTLDSYRNVDERFMLFCVLGCHQNTSSVIDPSMRFVRFLNYIYSENILYLLIHVIDTVFFCIHDKFY